MKRALVILLSLLLFAALATVQAQSGSGDDFYYTINPNTTNSVTVTGYFGSDTAVIIPTSINGQTVTSIGVSAFEHSDLTSATIPSSVMSIGDSALEYCTNLADVTIASGVTNIGDYAFYQCYSLANIAIPKSVNSIGYAAFGVCSGLISIMVATNNPAYSSVNGVLFDKSQDTLIQFPGGLGGSYTIPASVTNVEQEAFFWCANLTSLTIPNNVAENVGEGAFMKCYNLTSVYFLGDAPSTDSSLFESDNNVTVYYLNGTSGWSSSFAGVPTAELTSIAITVNPTSGNVPLKVSFTSADVDSVGHAITNWNWSFGDGSTSTFQNPSHSYINTGLFTVSLIENNNALPIAGAGTSITVTSITASNQPFTTLYSFSFGNNGANPNGGLILSGDTLYGTAENGGSSDSGMVFKINTDGTDFATLYSFTNGNDGANPESALILSGDTLYGTTGSTVFSINTNGSGFATLTAEAGSSAGLVLSGNSLYGTTEYGGSQNNGTVFTVNTDGTGFTTLYSFSALDINGLNNDGANPVAGLISSSNTLYGTTQDAGSGNNGTVFAVNTDGTGFTTLHAFTATTSSPPYSNGDGADPVADLILSGNTLYGTASSGGSSGYGTVFAVNTDGTGFVTVHSFTSIIPGGVNSDGVFPLAGLISSGNALYGTAYSGGSQGSGTVFSVNTDGSGFTTLYTFTGAQYDADGGYYNGDGINPRGNLILSSNTLYGTAQSGGVFDGGTVFSLLLAPVSSSQGFLQVNIEPFTAVSADAQWQVDYGTWQNSGTTVANLAAGYHTVTFSTVSGWATPTNQTIYITANSTNTINEIYLLGGSGDNYDYTINSDNTNTITITSYLGSDEAVTIPTSINNLTVTIIGDEAFEGIPLAGITIPNSVTSIGVEAFDGTILTSVTIPSSVTNIGAGAFGACPNLAGITVDASNPDYISVGGVLFNKKQTTLVEYPAGAKANYTIPNSVTSIGEVAFFACDSLTTVTIPASVTSIGDGAFEGCFELTSVTIPNSVTSIGSNVFEDCASLTGIAVSASNPSYSSVSGVLFNKNRTMLIDYPLGRSENSYAIPDGVANIISDAFWYCGNLSSVAIPSSVTNIGDGAFVGCSGLSGVLIPGSVTSIGVFAFGDCSSLTNICFLGNEPFDGGDIFDSDTALSAVYYIKGTIGWGATFSGVDAEPCAQCGVSVVVDYTIVVSAFPSAGGIVSGGGTVVSGSSQTVLATGDNGYMFTNWTENGDVVSTSNSYSFILNSNMNLVANFTSTKTSAFGLTLLTNGTGTVQHVTWPKNLVIGKEYTVTATPKSGNLFSNWVGGTAEPYSVLSSSANYTFTMQDGLVLEANFVSNPFTPEEGTFSGLYLDTNNVTEASSGFFTLKLMASGAFTGKIMTSGSTYSLPTTMKFGVGGQVQFTVPTKQNTLTFNLQLDIGDPGSQQITGTVSNGTWTAGLTADRAVFNATGNTAVNYEGRYTLAIAGSEDGATSPGGFGCATLSINSAGLITMAGNLADGTSINQSVSVSKDGRWPFYTSYTKPPAGNGGAVLSWITFSNEPASALGGTIYWFRPAGKTPSVYQSGFTNMASIVGSAYNPTDKPLLALANGQVTLDSGDLPFAITNQITLSPSGTITVPRTAENTNKLALTITKTTGTISGSFANPSNPKKTITVKGILLQNQTNAVGYFLATNQSGAFLLENP